tara:strand:+ start:599 stop:1099 length:501 start_codon:yes stop_codon:yes gene_type:complete
MKGVFCRTEKGSLVGTEPDSWTMLARMKLGDLVTCEIKKVRSPEQHRMFFALLKTIFENQERYASMEALLDAVKIYAGHYEEHQFPQNSGMFHKRLGKTMVVLDVEDITPEQLEKLREIWTQVKPKSISWGDLDHDDFQPIFHAAVELGHKLLGVDPIDLLNEAQE